MSHGRSRLAFYGAWTIFFAVAILLVLFVRQTSNQLTTSSPVPQASPQSSLGISVGATLSSLGQQELNKRLDDMVGLGIGWLRFDIDWGEIQPQGPESFRWDGIDRIVAAAHARNMQLLAIVDYTPAWARVRGCSTSKCPPADNAAFASFAATAAQRYASKGIGAWEVWNEPNLVSFWRTGANPVAYSALLKATYAAIKSVDQTATVITGGMGPASTTGGDMAPVDFLTRLYASGAGDSFDAVGYHPYSFPARPSHPSLSDGWSQMAATGPSLRSVMIANGDTAKQIWMTEFGAPTGGQNAVTEDAQAAIIRDAVTLAPTYAWAGPLFIYSYQDLGTSRSTNENFFGVLRFDGSPKASYEMLQSLVR